MNSEVWTVEKIVTKILDFRNKRNWHITDTPANLAKSIIIEAAELLENFQWSDRATDIVNVKEELADILIYSIAMADELGFDLEEMISEKLLKNAIKYPVLEKK